MRLSWSALQSTSEPIELCLGGAPLELPRISSLGRQRLSCNFLDEDIIVGVDAKGWLTSWDTTSGAILQQQDPGDAPWEANPSARVTTAGNWIFRFDEQSLLSAKAVPEMQCLGFSCASTNRQVFTDSYRKRLWIAELKTARVVELELHQVVTENGRRLFGYDLDDTKLSSISLCDAAFHGANLHLLFQDHGGGGPAPIVEIVLDLASLRPIAVETISLRAIDCRMRPSNLRQFCCLHDSPGQSEIALVNGTTSTHEISLAEQVDSIQFSRDGKFLAAICSDGTLHVIDVDQGRVVCCSKLPVSRPFHLFDAAIAFSPNGHRIIINNGQTAYLGTFELA